MQLALTMAAVATLIMAEPATLPRPQYRLKYHPRIASVDRYVLLNKSSNGAGRMYSATGLGERNAYSLGDIRVLELSGSPEQVGFAYGELMGREAEDLYKIWVGFRVNASMIPVIDWLWDCLLVPHTPDSFISELKGVRRGGESVGVRDLDRILSRVVTVSNLPADAQNIQAVIEDGIQRVGPPSNSSSCARRVPAMRAAAASLAEGTELPTLRSTGHCDFFAAWGPMTEDGRLISTRNLDITADTGISAHKLVTVYRIDGQHPYATFGFSGYFGALAGMSSAGITVSEANLDNGRVSFDGIAWPIRLRQLLGRAESLAEAKRMWASINNTAAFNFLVGSASDAPAGPAAVALETVFGYNGEFEGDSEVEANATYACINGTVTDGRACEWPNNGGTAVRIGEPMRDAVFRSNHALNPRVMKTQEPLWNDTVMRYLLLHDRISEAADGKLRITAEKAVNITSLLGIKGSDYGSCDPSTFNEDSTHVLSVVYDPSKAEAYVAWEDGHAKTWTPAACNAYVRMDMRPWFQGRNPAQK